MSAVLDPAQTPLHRAPDQMGQALLLAVLLHVLLLLAVGNAPGGSAKPGEGAWGPLNVRLQGDRFEPGSGEPATVLPERGPPGDAKQPRFGGTVREQPPTPEELKTPGAARQGQWRQQAGDELIGDIAEERSAPPEPAPAKPTPKPTPRPITTPTPKPTPALKPAPTPSPIPAAEAPPAAPEVTTLTTPTESSVTAPTRIAPSRDAAPVRPTLPSEGLQAPSSELNLPERPAPMLSETPTTVRRLDRAPIERTVTPPMPNELKAPAELPPLTPVAPAPTPTPAPVPSPAPAPKPLAAPPAPKPTPQVTPAPPAATPAATPAPTPAPTPQAAPTTTPPTPQPRVAPTPSAAPANRISLDGSSSPTSTQPSVGAPDAGARVGHDVATPASTPPNAPKLNLDLNPSRGPMRPKGASSGLIQAVPKPPEDKDPLAEEMRKAGQQDCRKAYADKGLLAVVPLVRDAARDKGCRW